MGSMGSMGSAGSGGSGGPVRVVGVEPPGLSRA